MPARHRRRLVDQRAQDHVAAVRAAVDRQPPVGPRLPGRPAGRVDQVVDVGVAPLALVGLAECAAVAGRPAEVDVEDGEPLGHQPLLERHEGPERLAGRAAVHVEDGRHAPAAALARRRRRPPHRPFDGQPVTCLEHDPLDDRGRGRAPPPHAERNRERIGHLARARVRRPPHPGREAARDPAAVPRSRRSRPPRHRRQPADRTPDAVPRIDPAVRPRPATRSAASWAAGPRPRFSGGAGGELADEQILEPVVDFDVDEPPPVGRRQRRVADTHRPARRARAFRWSTRPGRGRRRSGGRPGTSRRRPTRTGSEPSASQRAPTSTLCSPATTRLVPVATSTSAICEVSRGSGSTLRHHRDRACRPATIRYSSTSMPVSVRTVGAVALDRSAGRPRRGTGRVDQPDLGPAAAARNEGQPPAVGRPACLAATARLGDRHASGATRRPP